MRARPALQELERRLTPTGPIPPPSGLVSWWPGDGDATDIVGPNSGSLVGPAGHHQGYVADGFEFDGQSGLMEAPTIGLPVGSADRTLALWVRIDQQDTNESFFASYGAPGSGNQVYALGRVSDHKLFVSTWGPALFGPMINDDQWYFVAASNQGTAFNLYLDGSLVASGTMSINTPADSTFWLGRLTPGSIGDGRRLDGMVDEVTVFDRALSGAEIQSMYQAGHYGMLKPYMVVTASAPGQGDALGLRPLEFTVDFSHPVSPASLQASDFAVNGTPATSFTIVDACTVRFQYAVSPVIAPGLQSMSMAAGSVSASDNPAQPLLRAWSKSFNYAPSATAPVVQSIQVEDGSAQRSSVTTLTVTFDGPVTFDAGNANAAAAFALTRVTGSGGAVGLSANVSTNAFGQTVVVLTFTGTTAIDPVSLQNGGPASLADGRYRLTVLDGAVTGSDGQALDGDGNGTAGGAYQSAEESGGPGPLRLYRLFGDATGNGLVDLLDLATLRSTFNADVGGASYLSYLDADNSGTVDLADLGEFRSRFNQTVF